VLNVLMAPSYGSVTGWAAGAPHARRNRRPNPASKVLMYSPSRDVPKTTTTPCDSGKTTAACATSGLFRLVRNTW